MPAFYTHSRFGKQVLESLNPTLQEMIKKPEDLFFIGLQGPDILFYHKAYKKNAVSKRGYEMHYEAGDVFFNQAREIIKNINHQKASFSYIAGFICHFTLDSQCHPYIGVVEREKNLSHSEIEAEEDRYLMIQDGLDPLRHIDQLQVVGNDRNSRVIADFFQGISPREIKQALHDMKFFSKIFCAPGKLKRGVVRLILKLAGQYKSLNGMIINYEENPTCHESTMRIAELSQEAVPIAVDLIAEFYEAVANEQVVLSERYKMTFGE